MVGKLAAKGKKWAMVGAVGGIDQPAVKFDAGARTRRWHTAAVRRQHVFQSRDRRIFTIEGFERMAVGPQLVAERVIVGGELAALEVQSRLEFSFMKHGPSP